MHRVSHSVAMKKNEVDLYVQERKDLQAILQSFLNRKLQSKIYSIMFTFENSCNCSGLKNMTYGLNP